MSVDGFLRAVPSDADSDDGRLYDPTVADAGGAATITDAGGIASAAALGQPAILAAVDAAGIATAEAIGQPVVAATVDAAGVASAESLGQPAVGADIVPASVPSAEAVGDPALAIMVDMAGIVSAEAFGEPLIQPVEEAVVDGRRALRRRRHTPAHFRQRTPEDIRREQLEDERYLASLEKPQQVPATARRGKTGEDAFGQAPETTTPTAPPTLADLTARAASAVQAKIAEAESAAARDLLAEQQQRRRMLVLLLALDD